MTPKSAIGEAVRTAAMDAAGAWLRDGFTVYSLVEDGYRRGEPVMVNAWTAHVQGSRFCQGVELEAVARLIEATPVQNKALHRAKSAIERALCAADFHPADVDMLNVTLGEIEAALSSEAPPLGSSERSEAEDHHPGIRSESFLTLTLNPQEGE